MREEKYKTEKCKVLGYNKITGMLDVKFKCYGLRLKYAKNKDIEDSVNIKYRGEIGKANFVCRI